jgi:hypothetical protein
MLLSKQRNHIAPPTVRMHHAYTVALGDSLASKIQEQAWTQSQHPLMRSADGGLRKGHHSRAVANPALQMLASERIA